MTKTQGKSGAMDVKALVSKLAEQVRTKCEAELVDGYYEADNPGEVLFCKPLLNKKTRECRRRSRRDPFATFIFQRHNAARFDENTFDGTGKFIRRLARFVAHRD